MTHTLDDFEYELREDVAEESIPIEYLQIIARDNVAAQMDIDDIHDKFGDKYDEGIDQMKQYYNKLKEAGRV